MNFKFCIRIFHPKGTLSFILVYFKNLPFLEKFYLDNFWLTKRPVSKQLGKDSSGLLSYWIIVANNKEVELQNQ